MTDISEDCVKKTIIIDNENYYLVVGKSFVMATVPRENDPMMSATRMAVETLRFFGRFKGWGIFNERIFFGIFETTLNQTAVVKMQRVPATKQAPEIKLRILD